MLRCSWPRKRRSRERDIDEGRSILEDVNEDVERRTKLLEEYAQMKAEMRRYEIGPEDPKRFSNVLQVLQRDNYDCAKIVNAFVDIEDTKKLRHEADNDRQNLETRLEEVKDTLPFAEQLLQYGVGINEVLAFKLAVDEKADMESLNDEINTVPKILRIIIYIYYLNNLHLLFELCINSTRKSTTFSVPCTSSVRGMLLFTLASSYI